MATMESVKVVVARREAAVLYRSEAEIMTSPRSAPFTPHAHRRLQCLLSAKSGHRARWGLRPTLAIYSDGCFRRQSAIRDGVLVSYPAFSEH